MPYSSLTSSKVFGELLGSKSLPTARSCVALAQVLSCESYVGLVDGYLIALATKLCNYVDSSGPRAPREARIRSVAVAAVAPERCVLIVWKMLAESLLMMFAVDGSQCASSRG